MPGEYLARVARAAEVEDRRTPKQTGLAEAVARNLFKLMAVKDEYEVARLYSDGTFARQVAATFEGEMKLEYPPRPADFRPQECEWRAEENVFWSLDDAVFKMLAKLKGLRGTPLDIFGLSKERRIERKLIADYESFSTRSWRT